jgi:hypothetical protein
MRKVAIIGKCSSTRADAPIFQDDWEVWALAWDPLPVCHRYFEVHANWRNFRGNDEDAAVHRRWMMGLKCPVYMREVEEDIPTSVAYPFDDVAKMVGNSNMGWPYIESSIGFMLALAILEKVPRIGIWGVDMGTTTEYAYQRPNMEYLVGFARGRGSKVFIPKDSALLSSAMDKPYGIWTQEDLKKEAS